MKAALMYIAIFFTSYFAVTFAFKKKKMFVDLPFSKDYSIIGKGLSIAIVVYGHLGNLFKIRYLTPLGGIGVAMFLILSGYGVSESWKKNGFQDYWKKRFLSVYIPYLIIEIVTIPIRGGYSTVRDALLDLTAIRSNYYLGWYITYQLTWYVLFYFARRYISNAKLRYSVWLAIGIMVLLLSRMLYARQAFSFILGVAFSDFKSWFVVLKKKRNVLGIAVLAVLLLGIKQIPLVRTTPPQVQNCLDMLLTTGFSIALLAFPAIVDEHILTPFYYLGIISYEIYLTHGYTLWMVDLTFTNALLFFTTTIGIAIISHIVLKRIQKALSNSLVWKGC